MPAIHVNYLFKDIAIPKDWAIAREMRGSIRSGVAGKVPLLHAAAIAVDSSGATRYYEYGRYDEATTNGIVRTISIDNFNMTDDGYPTRESLAALFNRMKSDGAFEAQGSVLNCIYYPGCDYSKIKEYAQNRIDHPEEYILGWNDCVSFAHDAIEVSRPWYSRISYGINDDGKIWSVPFYYLN